LAKTSGLPSVEEEIVSHPRFSGEEIAQRGRELYEQRLRPKVETDENIGKIISIDIETGDYAIDDDLLKAAHRVLDRHPDAALWMQRIGYDAVYAFGSSLTRTAG
jgi:hypothetical protein